MSKLTMVKYLSCVDQDALDDLSLEFSGRQIEAKRARAVERGYLTPVQETLVADWKLTAKGRARMRRTGPPEPPVDWPAMFAQDYWWRVSSENNNDWTSDGWIRVKDMSLTHKANTVAWLERNAERVILNLIATLERSILSMIGYSPGGEMAADALENAMDEAQEEQNKLRRTHKSGGSAAWVRQTEIYRRLALDVAAGRGREED